METIGHRVSGCQEAGNSSRKQCRAGGSRRRWTAPDSYAPGCGACPRRRAPRDGMGGNPQQGPDDVTSRRPGYRNAPIQTSIASRADPSVRQTRHMSSPVVLPVLVTAPERLLAAGDRLASAFADARIDVHLDADRESLPAIARSRAAEFSLVALIWARDSNETSDSVLETLAIEADLAHKLILITIAGEPSPLLP